MKPYAFFFCLMGAACTFSSYGYGGPNDTEPYATNESTYDAYLDSTPDSHAGMDCAQLRTELKRLKRSLSASKETNIGMAVAGVLGTVVKGATADDDNPLVQLFGTILGDTLGGVTGEVGNRFRDTAAQYQQLNSQYHASCRR